MSGYQGYQENRGRGRSNWRGRGNRGYQGRNPRSFSQIRADNQQFNKETEAKIEELQQKPVIQDAAIIAKNNPKKETPEMDAGKVKLDMDVQDWIEKHRANVEVSLAADFEDELIRVHAKQIPKSTTVLQYNSHSAIKEIQNTYTAYTVTNVAYRLLMTLPKSLKRDIADLLLHLQVGEQPRNTPLISEMLCHIGKHRNESYGNVRIDGQLLEARRKIVKAMHIVQDQKDITSRFRFRHPESPRNIDLTKEAIWDDIDSFNWLRRRALEEYERLRKQNHYLGDKNAAVVWDNTVEGVEKLLFSVPYIEMHENDPITGKRFTLSETAVKWMYKHTVGYLEEQQKPLMAVMMIMFMDFEFFKTFDIEFATYYKGFATGFDRFAGATMLNLLEYLGLQSYAYIMSDDDLIYNYNVIGDAYLEVADPTIRTLFRLVPISKDEFGDESQIMTIERTEDWYNPKVNSAFKIKDPQKIGAAAIFGYAKKVAFKIADYTILRRNKQAIISELVSKHSLKR